jgi:hypothetical protein
MASYTDGAELSRGIGMRRATVVAVVALLIGLVVGRATVGRGDPDGSGRGSAPAVSTSRTPAGYSHDAAGAASAAANLSAELARSIGAGPERVRETADRVGTASYSARVSAAYEGGHALDPGTVFRTIPISYRVLVYSPESAAVRIWSASVLAGEDTKPGVASFKTATIVVRWEEGSWRVDEVRDPVTGPTPLTAAPDQGNQFAAAVGRMEGFDVRP